MASGNGKPAPDPDVELARVVVEKGLATQADVDECLAERQRLAAGGTPAALDRIMVAKGVLTERQLVRAKKSLEEIRSTEQIPGYQILARLGAGAMATVFKARQVSLDRLVAIKVLPKRFTENPEYVERFYKEGKAAAKLNHPNIVQAIDVGEASGYHYFVMEYVEGHTVFDELDKGKVFSEEEALGIIIQIARALVQAHERGLIHRDVKPKNIMLTPDGLAKLADMGLARMASDEQAAQAEAGKAYGTPYYISPEQIRGELDIDFRADIYGLGATLYHMVTGRVPFEGDTPAAVMHMHLREPLIPPDHINAKLSVGLGEVVEVMMAKRRQDRYPSTKDLLVDLEAIAHGQPPTQVRKVIDAEALSGLADSRAEDQSAAGPATAPIRWVPSPALFYALLAALGVSVILNLILAMI